MFPLSISSLLKQKLALLLGLLLTLTIAAPYLYTHSYSLWKAEQGISLDIAVEVEPPAYIYEWGVGRFSSVNSVVPTMVPLSEAMKPKQIAGGNGSLLFAVNDGELWGVGNNTYGQLGNGTTNRQTSYTPTKVALPVGTEIVDSSTVQNFSLAVDSEGQVWGWGDNYYGQLGNGTTTPQNTYSPTPTKAVLPDGVKAVAVSAGFSHSLALTGSGDIYAWGYGQNGKLGTGSSANQSSPTKVLTPPDTVFVKVAATFNASIALTDDGKIYSWGLAREAGQAGNFATPNLLPFSETNTAMNIAGGNKSGHAVLTDGTVWSWGEILGKSATYSSTPTQDTFPDPVNIVELSVAKSPSTHALALTDDGELYAWGNNSSGQLGDGTTTNQMSPVKVLLPDGVKALAISATGGSSVALFDGADDGLSLLSGGEQSARATSTETAGKQSVSELSADEPSVEASTSQEEEETGAALTTGDDTAPELSPSSESDDPVSSVETELADSKHTTVKQGEGTLSVGVEESTAVSEDRANDGVQSLQSSLPYIQSEDEQSGEEPTLLQSALFSESPLTVFFSTVVSFLAPETNFSLSPLHSRYVKGHASQWSV